MPEAGLALLLRDYVGYFVDANRRDEHFTGERQYYHFSISSGLETLKLHSVFTMTRSDVAGHAYQLSQESLFGHAGSLFDLWQVAVWCAPHIAGGLELDTRVEPQGEVCGLATFRGDFEARIGDYVLIAHVIVPAVSANKGDAKVSTNIAIKMGADYAGLARHFRLGLEPDGSSALVRVLLIALASDVIRVEVSGLVDQAW